MKPPCRVAGCDHPSKARGLCGAHYERLCRLGDVHAERPIGYADPPPEPGPCKCEHPDPHHVVMFGFIRLLDVLECGRCYREVRERAAA